MAHPDPHRQGSEHDQRRHVGQTGAASDLGTQDKSQGKGGTATPRRKDEDVSDDTPDTPRTDTGDTR